MVALAMFFGGQLFSLPDQIGDLDEDGRYTIRDVARIVNHLQRNEFLPAEIQPYADVNEDGQIDRQDVDKLIEVILEQDSIDTIPLAQPIGTSPFAGEDGVSLTRETVVRFSLPLADTVILDQDTFYASFGGKKLLTRAEISSDRLKASLFYLDYLPDSARVRVTLKGGDAILDNLDRPVDLNRDGEAGGDLVFDFDTASITPVPETGVIGTVYASQADSQQDTPLAGVIIEIVGAEESSRTVTASDGTFRLEPVPAGRFFVNIDGRMVTGNYPNGDYYPFVGKTWHAVAGNPDNLANGTGEIFLPLVSAGTLQTVSATEETTIDLPQDVLDQFPEMAGTRLDVPANSLFSNDGTRGGRVGIAPVASDRLPEPLPMGLDLPMVITIQTDGATNFDVPVPVRLPNLPDPVSGEPLAPGSPTSLWSFDHDTGQWEIAGTMTVSPDGLWVDTDPGVGVRQPGWHGSIPGCPGYGGGPDPFGFEDEDGYNDDIDGDGIPNSEDPDIDGDGIPNDIDPDIDGDGIPNESDPDQDGDGINDEDDPDDDNDGTPDLCNTTCIEPGELTNLVLNRDGPATACKGDTISFSAAGVIDTGGTGLRECKDEEGNITSTEEVDIAPGTPTYNWVIRKDGAIVATGTGPVASVKADSTGTYTANMTASVTRKCLDTTVDLNAVSTNVVDRNNFTAYGITTEIPAPTPVIKKIEDTINLIPRVSVKLEPGASYGLEAGQRQCCKDGSLTENGEWYAQASMGISGSIDAQVWGPPGVDERFDWGFASGVLYIKAGLFINTSIGASVTAGIRKDICKPEDCIYGSFKSSIAIATQVKFEVIAVAHVLGREFVVDDLSFVVTFPLQITVFGSITYNKNDACDGFKGNAGLDDIVFVASVTLSGKSLPFQRTVWESTAKWSTP